MPETPPRPRLFDPAIVADFAKGPATECRQFDFLLGEWDATTRRYDARGEIALEHPARWSARLLFGGRVLEDRYVALAPDGRPVGASVTLRAWCPSAQRWEMTFLTAGQPQRVASFTGRAVGEEMHLDASGVDLDERPTVARVRFFDITPDGFAWDQRSRLASEAGWNLDATTTAVRRRGWDGDPQPASDRRDPGAADSSA